MIKEIKYNILRSLHVLCLASYRESMNVAELIGISGLYHRKNKTKDSYYLNLNGIIEK